MLNIEKQLDSITIEHKNPSQKLIDDTIFEIHKISGKRGLNWDWLFNIKMIASFSLSVATLLIMLAINVNGSAPVPVHAYYSIDINPSVIISVNANEEVIAIEGLNDDAELILKDVNLLGLHSKEAITRFVELAKNQGYITEDNQYVLIGRFGSDNGEIVPEMQEYFEENFEDTVQVLIVTGTVEDKEKADEDELSPGLLELSQAVDGDKPDQEDGVGDVIEGGNEDIDLPAVTLKLEIDENMFRFKFEKLEFNADDYEGTIIYRLIRARTEEDLNNGNYETVVRRTYYSTDELPVMFERQDAFREYFYAVTVEYEGQVTKMSNTIYLEAEKFVDDGEKTITVSTSEEVINLSWTKAEGEDFRSYKVVASKTNENPKYPEDGYLINITNVNTNSLTINPGDFELEEETKYYFSITYLYEEDTRYANVVSATTGKIEYITQSNITSSSRDGNKIYVNWEKVTKNNFKSYKLMYSFTDSTPVYEESGSHYYVNITDINTTSAVIDISKIISKNTNSSEKIYVSITTLYNSDPYKVAGNAKVHNVPENLLDNEEPVATTITSHQLNGNTVSFNWSKIDLSILQGYKVVYSFTDSTPVYDESGTHSKYFITNKAETSAEINLESIIHKNTSGSEKVYISITSVYDDFNTKKASNTIAINIPEALLIDEEPIATEITNHELSGNTVSFNWNEIELVSLEGYKVVYSFTDSTPVYDESGTHYKQWITNKAQTSSSINLEDIMYKNTTGSTKVYISITSIYNDFAVKKPSNTITIDIPEALLSGEDEEPIASNITEHSISGNVISINWEQIDLNSFEGYKVVYSFTDPNPVYGGSYDGYYWITNQATTSKSVNLEDIIHENDSGSNTVYFSITTLYSSHSVKKQGNAVSFTVPEALLEEPEEPIAANLTSAVLAEEETKISLVWDKIELTQFKKYIVTYSFTNPNPIWGGEGSFDYHIITDRNTTTYLMTLQDLLDEKPEGSTEVYIAITAYYNDGTKKQGNAKTVVFPSGE